MKIGLSFQFFQRHLGNVNVEFIDFLVRVANQELANQINDAPDAYGFEAEKGSGLFYYCSISTIKDTVKGKIVNIVPVDQEVNCKHKIDHTRLSHGNFCCWCNKALRLEVDT